MIKSCYREAYYVATKSNSMAKLRAVAQSTVQHGLAELIHPEFVAIEELLTLHDPQLVMDFLAGKKPRATLQGLPWSQALRDSVLAINGGQLCAAEIALVEGVSANIAQGFHHATYEYSSGFCTFNGLALVAQRYPNKRIFVLDCDQHGGNGTAEFTERLKNLYNYTIFGLPYGCREFERSRNALISHHFDHSAPFFTALNDALDHILLWKTDLIVYQAGVDGHKDDPCGSVWCGDEQLMQRDRLVFEFAKRHGIPIMFVLAGGYQSIERTAELHTNTFRACHTVFKG